MNTLFLIVLFGGVLVIISCLVAIFWFGGLLLPLIFSGAPFVPSSKERVQTMMRVAEIKSTDRVIDLGSGNGQLLIGAIKAGAESAEGYEIHPGLVWFSRWRAKKIKEKIRIYQKSFWDADVSKATVIFLYQLPNHMAKLETKLQKELPTGARVISNAFTFPNWKPVKQEGKISIYIK